MKRKKNSDSFWASYVDVMTNLFAITLMLFVVSFFWFRNSNEEIDKLNQLIKDNERLEVYKAEYDRIQELNNAIKSLDSNKYFTYNEECQKHILNLSIQFRTGYEYYQIPDHLVDPSKVDEIQEVGRSIIRTIEELRDRYISNQNAYSIKFLVVIEGQASRSGNEYLNYILSYQRALSLKQLWDNVSYNGKKITNEELNCEVVVSGSGWYGKPREDEEYKNQRFLVHIVPVIEWEKR